MDQLLQRNNEKILITLDKFDDYFDHFGRQYADDKSTESVFMSDLLEGLLLAVRDLRQASFFSKIHMLFTVPADRFYNIPMREREQLEEKHVADISWNPLELLNFANKRIAWALNIPEDNAWNHLFPLSVSNRVLREVKENSFLFLVRHSHWRPRDIQRYVFEIISEMERREVPADEEIFHRAVATCSREIIRREFIPEYQKTYPNIANLIEKLESIPGLPTCISYKDLASYVQEYPFSSECNLNDIMRRLFEMGMIGIRKRRQVKTIGINGTVTQGGLDVSYCFFYNSKLLSPFDGDVPIVFHPIFYDRLDLIHKVDFVIHELRWEMLE